MRYFKCLMDSEMKKIFHKSPGEFNNKSDINILRYCVGALLYIPAVNKKMLNSFVNKQIKELTSVSICLEDSVGKNGEAEGIRNMSQAFCDLRVNIDRGVFSDEEVPLIFIRPKNTEQMLKFKDVLQENSDLITGIIIPKANAEIIEDFLNVLDKIQCSSLYIMPIIETTEFTDITKKYNALDDLYKTVEKYQQRILNIRIGVTDILGAYRLRRNKNFTIYDNMLFHKFSSDLLSIFGDNDKFDIPISGGVSEFYDMKNPEILESYLREMDIDRLNGFIGKTVIHPLQMKVVQAKHVVSYEDYLDAKNIIASVDEKSGVSAGIFKERMNEVNPHLKWAQKVITLSYIYGVFNEGMNFNDILRF